jgi:hypothetical protein
MIEIVTAVNNQEILNKNLGASPNILQTWYPDVHYMRGFTNISKAYNSAREKIKSPLVMYVHQDVFLPENFQSNLQRAFERLPDNWGVLGVAGVKLIDGKKQNLGHISDRGKGWGSPWKLPAEVDTLDELLLITRGDLVFDENLDTDFYGADICMQARLQGRKCYAINAYCEHNSSRPVGGRTESFYKCEKYFREKYIDHLPIVTTCSLLN